jgi:hypothetical protein
VPAAGHFVGLREQAVRLLLDLALVGEAQRVQSDRCLLRQRDGGQLLRFVTRRRFHRLAVQKHVIQGLIDRVEYDGCARRAELQLHRFGAADRQRGGVGHYAHTIIERHDIFR